VLTYGEGIFGTDDIVVADESISCSTALKRSTGLMRTLRVLSRVQLRAGHAELWLLVARM
jgi:hypothetical protein